MAGGKLEAVISKTWRGEEPAVIETGRTWSTVFVEDGTFYFKKGIIEKYHYKNLSAGEKSAFDLILDLIIKQEYYPGTK